MFLWITTVVILWQLKVSVILFMRIMVFFVIFLLILMLVLINLYIYGVTRVFRVLIFDVILMAEFPPGIIIFGWWCSYPDHKIGEN